MQVKDIYAVVEQDFTAVDTLIREQLSSRVPLVEKIADYIVSSGGKRLRPLLVIMTAKALSSSRQLTRTNSPLLSNSSTQQRFCTTMLSIPLICAAETLLPTQNGVMPPAFWSVTFCTPAPFR